MGSVASFSCDCGQITGEVQAVPHKGLHLVCFCPSCRAGALYCGDKLAADAPVDLYLTPPHNVQITAGGENLGPFAFDPKGILRWKANCCGVQMFSSQANPKIAFMSVRGERFADKSQLGPVKTKAFVPQDNGKARQVGIGGLATLIFRALVARLTGKWRNTPLYHASTGKPVSEVTLLSKEEKRILLSEGA